MRFTAILMLVLAVAMGATSVYLARDWLQRQGQSGDAAAGPSIELTTVVVAKLPMNFGDEVTKEYLEEVDWPAATVPPNSFRTIEELTVSGESRVVLRSIQINEPVLESKLSGAGGKATLATILDKEMRAVTIRVNDVNGVAGFILPGDRVDVLLTREENQGRRNSNQNPITDILLQNVKVLGIDQKANDDEDKPKVARAVTLEVEPFDAQKLALATTVGSLSLALRHEANADADYTRTVRVSDLKARVLVEEPKAEKVSAASGETATKPAKKKRKVYVTPANPYSNVTVVRGVDTSTSKVLKDKEKKARPASAGLSTPTTSKPAATQEETAPGGPKIIVPQG
jgi:pilus assembly protein CpaB